MSFQDLGHFKDEIIQKGGVTEEEWKKYAEEHWSDWTQEKRDALYKEYDEYRKIHAKESKCK